MVSLPDMHSVGHNMHAVGFLCAAPDLQSSMLRVLWVKQKGYARYARRKRLYHHHFIHIPQYHPLSSINPPIHLCFTALFKCMRPATPRAWHLHRSWSARGCRPPLRPWCSTSRRISSQAKGKKMKHDKTHCKLRTQTVSFSVCHDAESKPHTAPVNANRLRCLNCGPPGWNTPQPTTTGWTENCPVDFLLSQRKRER